MRIYLNTLLIISNIIAINKLDKSNVNILRPLHLL